MWLFRYGKCSAEWVVLNAGTNAAITTAIINATNAQRRDWMNTTSTFFIVLVFGLRNEI
jgi:hypothetical protein